MCRSIRTLLVLAMGAAITGCVASRPAPVSDRTPVRPPAPAPAVVAKPAPGVVQPRSELYTVKPGDTLYSIALEHGVDYRELALWNGIDNPAAMRIGQQLRVTAPATTGVVTAPLRAPGAVVEAKPLSSGPAPAISSERMVTEPKGQRLPYSEQALAQLSKSEASPARTEPRVELKSEPRLEPKPDAKPEPRRESEAPRGPDDLDWMWPTSGKVIGTFNDATSKGIVIAGRLGQPVLASAPGRVIFSGTGIRGFGKLIVIKHNNTYLSVYAHNSELLVKEGQTVSKGQRIAEMGSTDSDQVKLHFEIRRMGKPIDPIKLLPERSA